jgi:hypothetical protein
LVRTPEFKSWFGDWEQAYRTGNYDGVSKIIDENGEPMVMYHGSIQRGITEFTEEGAQRGRTSGLREYGVSFTSVRDLAQGYAKGRAKRAFQMSPEYRPDVDVSPSVYAAFLKIDNPFVYDAKLKFFPHWMKDIPYMTLSEGLRYGKSGRAAFEAVMGGNDIYNSPYDGAVIENVNDINDTEFTYQDKPRLTESTGALVQIPFSSKPTIKLADGSNTTFRTSPNSVPHRSSPSLRRQSCGSCGARSSRLGLAIGRTTRRMHRRWSTPTGSHSRCTTPDRARLTSSSVASSSARPLRTRRGLVSGTLWRRVCS